MSMDQEPKKLHVIKSGVNGGATTSNIEALAAKQSAKAEDGERISSSTTLIGLAAKAELFHSPDHLAHAGIDVRGQRRVCPIRSAIFRQWLRWEFYRAVGRAPPAQALEEALGVLEARAEFDGPERATFIRVGAAGGDRYIDLATKEEPSFVKVSPDGWELVKEVPVPFVRPNSVQALPVPVKGATVDLLRPFVNVSSEEMFILLVVWLLAALHGGMAVPVLVLQGPQGAAKSSLLRLLRMLTDPAKGILRGQPRHEQDLAIASARSWLVTFDNLSFIPGWLSDAFCRVVTGGAFAARQLFTDGEEVIFEYRRPIIINGIEQLVTSSDLLNRAAVVSLPLIEPDARRDDEEFWSSFRTVHPLILGALLDLLCGALRHLPSVNLPRKPRMADFAKLGVAMETYLGWTPGTFIAAYTSNRSTANDIAIEASLIGPFITMLATQSAGWHGSPDALLKKLDEMYEHSRAGMDPNFVPLYGSGISKSPPKPKKWPSNAQQLSAALERILPNLIEIGVRVERGKTPGSGSHRFINLSMKPSPMPGGPHTPTPTAAAVQVAPIPGVAAVVTVAPVEAYTTYVPYVPPPIGVARPGDDPGLGDPPSHHKPAP